MTQATQADPFAAPVSSSAADDPFGSPAPKAAKAPRIMDLGVGRLIMLRPCKATTDTQPAHPSALKANPGATVERMTADLVVLDGEPYGYGGKPENGQSHTEQGRAGQRFNSVWYTQKGLVNQVMTGLDANKNPVPRFGSAKPWALGRLYKGPAGEGNPPWLIADPTPQDVEIARAYFRANPADPFGN